MYIYIRRHFGSKLTDFHIHIKYPSRATFSAWILFVGWTYNTRIG